MFYTGSGSTFQTSWDTHNLQQKGSVPNTSFQLLHTPQDSTWYLR